MVIFLLYCYLEACDANCQCVVCDVEFAGFSLKECSDLGFLLLLSFITILGPQKFKKRD